MLIPTLTGLILSVVTMLVAALPVAILVIYVRKNAWGQFAIGVLLGVLLLVLVAIINILAIMSSNLAGSVLGGQVPSAAEAWKRISSLGADLFWMGIGLPAKWVWLALRRLFRASHKQGWEGAEHLLVPILANEAITLREAPGKIARMQTDNCVFMAESVGVRKLNLLLVAAAILVGLAAGSGIAWLIISGAEDPNKARATAFLLAILAIAIFTLPVLLFCSHTFALFNTCLYIWGKSVRTARKDKKAEAAIPEPLAVALGVRPGR